MDFSMLNSFIFFSSRLPLNMYDKHWIAINKMQRISQNYNDFLKYNISFMVKNSQDSGMSPDKASDLFKTNSS